MLTLFAFILNNKGCPNVKRNGFPGFPHGNAHRRTHYFAGLQTDQQQEDPAMLQQTLQFQKEVCNASFTIATSIQENCENILKDTLELYPLMPKEGKELCLYCSEQYWLSMNRLKKTSLASIDLFEKFTAPPSVASEKKAGRGKTTAPAEPKKTTAKTKATVKNTGAAKKQKSNEQTNTVSANTVKAAEKQESGAKVEQAEMEKPSPTVSGKKTQASTDTKEAGKS